MLKYNLAAAALKVFSLNSQTMRWYRRLGNLVGGRSRSQGIPPHYVTRAHENLRFIEQHHTIEPGQTILELGTGWVHWEAVFTRLFHDVRIIAFDIWDNRQFDGFQKYFGELKTKLPGATDRSKEEVDKALQLVDRLLQCSSFEEVYDLLDMCYIIDAEGKLDAIADNEVDLVISSDVMEHIPASTLPRLVDSLGRVLKPGGVSSQQIVQADHLVIYDRSAHRKSYLRYSDRQWAMRFDNQVQYMNRWQHSDFVRLYKDHEFDIVAEAIVETADTGSIDVADRWAGYEKSDLDICVSRLLARNSSAELRA